MQRAEVEKDELYWVNHPKQQTVHKRSQDSRRIATRVKGLQGGKEEDPWI